MTNIYAGWQLQAAVLYQAGSGSLPAGMTTWRLLDGVQRITYKLSEGVEAKEECGTRFVTLLEGVYALTGTIERYYTGSGPLAGIYTVANNPVALYQIQIFPATSGSGNPYINLNGVKFNDIEIQHRPMANAMIETWTFVGTGSITTGSC